MNNELCETRIVINGEVFDDEHQTGISPMDRGFQFGDGVFETIACRNNQLELWDYHFNRMQNGCDTLRMYSPSETSLLKDISKILRPNEDCVVKIVVSRGVSGRGYLPAADAEATRVCSVSPLNPISAKGLDVVICDHRLPVETEMHGIKHCNRLDQVLARMEWENKGVDEGILCDFSRNIISGTMSNIFMVIDEKLITPDLTWGAGVGGTVRRLVLEVAKELGIETRVTDIKAEEILKAQEVFLTNSLMLVAPVKSLYEKNFANPGRLTKTLSDYINKVIDAGNFCLAL